MAIIRSRSPLRISFAGGGTDLPPYCFERGGLVVAATINRYSYATLETLSSEKGIHIESVDFLRTLSFGNTSELTYNNELDILKAVIKHLNTSGQGLRIWMRTDVPPRSGLGASAAAFAALIGVFNHIRREKGMTKHEIAELAFHLERNELNIHGGYQDQYATTFGGFNLIEISSKGVRVEPIRMKRENIMELEKHLVLIYTKDRPIQGDIIEAEKMNFKARKDVSDALDRTKELAKEVRYALIKGDFDCFGELLHDAWQSKKRHSDLVSNPYLDELYEAACEAGAIGGKVSGAGGGGFMFFCCRPNTEHRVIASLENLGARHVSFTFDFDGLQTWDFEDRR